mmetsp:Transcript_22282/g.66717  ORF Transcript_22282/g.66717 Transcript_22282/m.66717 type:complete len:263 (+) Transcript_22282:70-858(+)
MPMKPAGFCSATSRAVSWSADKTLGLARDIKSQRTTAACPAKAALWSGVSPDKSLAFASALILSNHMRADSCPAAAAMCTAVDPCASHLWASAAKLKRGHWRMTSEMAASSPAKLAKPSTVPAAFSRSWELNSSYPRQLWGGSPKRSASGVPANSCNNFGLCCAHMPGVSASTTLQCSNCCAISRLTKPYSEPPSANADVVANAPLHVTRSNTLPCRMASIAKYNGHNAERVLQVWSNIMTKPRLRNAALAYTVSWRSPSGS